MWRWHLKNIQDQRNGIYTAAVCDARVEGSSGLEWQTWASKIKETTQTASVSLGVPLWHVKVENYDPGHKPCKNTLEKKIPGATEVLYHWQLHSICLWVISNYFSYHLLNFPLHYHSNKEDKCLKTILQKDNSGFHGQALHLMVCRKGAWAAGPVVSNLSSELLQGFAPLGKTLRFSLNWYLTPNG